MEELKKDFVEMQLNDASTNKKAVKSENLLLRSVSFWNKSQALKILLNFLKKNNAWIATDEKSFFYEIFHKKEINLVNIEINERTKKIIFITKIGKSTKKNSLSFINIFDTYETLKEWNNFLKEG